MSEATSPRLRLWVLHEMEDNRKALMHLKAKLMHRNSNPANQRSHAVMRMLTALEAKSVCRKPYQKLTKINPSSTHFYQNPPRIHPKSCQNSHLELSWAVLAASWAIWAPRGFQDRNKSEKPRARTPLRGSILGGFPSHVCTMLGHANFYIKACI